MDLRNEYLEADEATKRFLEQRYGKRVIQKALEEMESKEWLEKNSKACPCCSTPIEVSVVGKGWRITVTPNEMNAKGDVLYLHQLRDLLPESEFTTESTFLATGKEIFALLSAAHRRGGYSL